MFLPYLQFHNKAFVLDKTVTKKLCLMLLFCYNENDEIGIYWGNKTFKVPEQVFYLFFLLHWLMSNHSDRQIRQ